MPLENVSSYFNWCNTLHESNGTAWDPDPELKTKQEAALNNHLLRLHHQARSARTPHSRFLTSWPIVTQPIRHS
jgi:hypothetical protein